MDLITAPPPADAIAAMQAIDGLRLVPAMLNMQSGPERDLGPENAGAVLILQASFADEQRFNAFWSAAAELMQLLATTPGFIRRVSFADGPNYTLIAFWRSLDEARAFFKSDAHQRVMRAQFDERWQYTHFAGLWTMASPRHREIFCQHCDGVTYAPAAHCTGCGRELFDPIRESG